MYYQINYCIGDMDFCFRELAGESLPSDQDILRCPFLRNMDAPTHFSFSSSLAMSLPMRGGGSKGPIFEDGPNFDMAFRIFHGRDGVVPLSGRSHLRSENMEIDPPAPMFNPLAARAATISLSGFGAGWPFSFDAFSQKWKNQKKKSQSSKGGDGKHEALSNEWMKTGNCPIAKSYRAVSRVVPLVAKVLQPPPGVKFECPRAIVVARAALARTALAKNLRPQPLPAKMLAIGVLGMAVNVPLGIWREHTKKFSPAWFAAVHAAVPFLGMLRKCVLMPKTAMAFTIGASILGQVIGSRAERYRLKAKAAKNSAITEVVVGEPKMMQVVTVNSNGHCGDMVKWDPLTLHGSQPSPSAGVCAF
ncbi:uncharacterized protein [Spinacia oleracea]|uniref:Uncharacterized protein isoform X1 n=2 Tax=Spinacia oleracea TaxID=3562 RepID=A0ABM3RNQ1_SPIOL|nr:uncharacterized protein LOC110803201 isoform X1 [Spinacia oleracea]